jgi:anthranilate synthase component 1
MKIQTTCTTTISDLTSPIAAYLRLRDRYEKVLLLESSDYHTAEDSRSFICCEPIAELRIEKGEVYRSFLGKAEPPRTIKHATGFAEEITSFLNSFQIESTELPKGVVNGIFGYATWDAIEYMEAISFTKPQDPHVAIPEARFIAYRYVLAFNPLKSEAYLVENCVEGSPQDRGGQELLRAAFDSQPRTHSFKLKGTERSLLSDDEFLQLILTCKKHIARGDVFQIVPSRRYTQAFEGDDFQVYRALRVINRSPYLFYCDFGGYRLFGSSPEAQIVVKDQTAGIYPIAGTTFRSGDDTKDREKVERLLEDPKENAEHCMLVDLARNDLSRHCKNVHVSEFRDVQYFSHVIHLVSKVEGTLPNKGMAPQITSDTFPAGTLSGAPKYRAIQILDENEKIRRGHYGGCVGLFGFNGDAILAIMIRSFLSINNTLVYQAGMGVVHDSDPTTEVEEVHAKLRALRLAMKRAEEISEGV